MNPKKPKQKIKAVMPHLDMNMNGENNCCILGENLAALKVSKSLPLTLSY
jgi:hypothetical protein